jgi:hypothetical protein
MRTSAHPPWSSFNPQLRARTNPAEQAGTHTALKYSNAVDCERPRRTTGDHCPTPTTAIGQPGASAHDADDVFAPVLQRGLQHLAKPWNRRRAMEVFRDESSLAVSPGLWPSIRAALDASRWFILLASPEAARSELTLPRRRSAVSNALMFMAKLSDSPQQRKICHGRWRAAPSLVVNPRHPGGSPTR